MSPRFALVVSASLLIVAACGSTAGTPVSSSAPVSAASSSIAPEPSGPRPALKGRLDKVTFRSAVLSRTMPLWVYLPPGYDANAAARYPALYLLHGGGGDIDEWPSYGMLDAADSLMGTGAIPPFIIALPFGGQEYWVDHVKNNVDNGEKWGTYTAKEVVPEVDRRYRTLATASARAIGGLSMGGHGAMQLPMNFPGVWSVIGAHGPSIRAEGDAASYLGRGAEFAARNPLALITANPTLARTYTWWLDSGSVDPWLVPTTAIHDKLAALGIPHECRSFAGDHSMRYWQAHLPEYLRYYAGALCTRSVCPPLP